MENVFTTIFNFDEFVFAYVVNIRFICDGEIYLLTCVLAYLLTYLLTYHTNDFWCPKISKSATTCNISHRNFDTKMVNKASLNLSWRRYLIKYNPLSSRYFPRWQSLSIVVHSFSKSIVVFTKEIKRVPNWSVWQTWYHHKPFIFCWWFKTHSC